MWVLKRQGHMACPYATYIKPLVGATLRGCPALNLQQFFQGVQNGFAEGLQIVAAFECEHVG